MDIGIKKQSTVCLLMELSEFALFLMLVSIVIYYDLCCSNRRTNIIEGVRLFNTCLPIVSIQISQLMVKSKIAMFDSVRVEHRNHVKNKNLAQHKACLAVAKKKSDEAFNEVRGRCF